MRSVIKLVTLVGLLTFFGCTNPTAEKIVAQREHSMQRVVYVAGEREGRCGHNLQRTLALFQKEFEQDCAEIGREIHKLGEYLNYDLKRWQQRQRTYRELFWRMFSGNPENIEPTAVYMFY